MFGYRSSGPMFLERMDTDMLHRSRRSLQLLFNLDTYCFKYTDTSFIITFTNFGHNLILAPKLFQIFRNLHKIKNPSIPGKKRNREIMTDRTINYTTGLDTDTGTVDSQTYETH